MLYTHLEPPPILIGQNPRNPTILRTKKLSHLLLSSTPWLSNSPLLCSSTTGHSPPEVCQLWAVIRNLLIEKGDRDVKWILFSAARKVSTGLKLALVEFFRFWLYLCLFCSFWSIHWDLQVQFNAQLHPESIVSRLSLFNLLNVRYLSIVCPRNVLQVICPSYVDPMSMLVQIHNCSRWQLLQITKYPEYFQSNLHSGSNSVPVQSFLQFLDLQFSIQNSIPFSHTNLQLPSPTPWSGRPPVPCKTPTSSSTTQDTQDLPTVVSSSTWKRRISQNAL